MNCAERERERERKRKRAERSRKEQGVPAFETKQLDFEPKQPPKIPSFSVSSLPTFLCHLEVLQSTYLGLTGEMESVQIRERGALIRKEVP